MKTITLNQLIKNITPDERKFIETEKKYYHIVVALKNLRESLGITQEQLAQKSKLPRTTITKVESGSRNTTIQTLMMIAQAMGKTIHLKLE